MQAKTTRDTSGMQPRGQPVNANAGKMPKGTSPHWLVEGYDSFTLKFRVSIPQSHITLDNLKAALRSLAAIDSLTAQEILSAFAKHRSSSYAPLLEVKKCGDQDSYMCGGNPHVVATTVQWPIANKTIANKKRATAERGR